MVKRKHKTLSLRQKHEIIEKLKNGRSPLQLATEYGVGRSTITDIKKKKSKIEQYMKSHEAESSQRLTLKQAENPNVESALYTWFLQQRSRNLTISGEILQEKAKYFYNEITGRDDFAASAGWLDNFKKRFKIRQLTITGEKLSSDFSAVDPFQKLFLEKVQELNLNPHQICNADESGLFWRVLPTKTLVHKDEDSAPGRKRSKERITFMPCANASGSHKLKMLVIGKAANPRAFKDCRYELPVVYKNHGSAWMTQEIFRQWFHDNFVPAVQAHLKEINLPPKALLLLDNAPSHPPEIELRSRDGLITVLYLPPNCTPLLQPIDQHVIQAIKMHYRKHLLFRLVSDENDPSESLKTFNLKDVIYSLHTSWQSVSCNLIEKSWNKLWPERHAQNLDDDDYTEEDNLPLAELVRRQTEGEKELQEMTVLMNVVSKGEKLGIDEVKNWVSGSTEENEEVVFTDQDLIAGCTASSANCSSDEEVEEVNSNVRIEAVSHEDAVRCFGTCLQWATENAASGPEILILRQLQERAANLRLKKVKQTSITDFFKY